MTRAVRRHLRLPLPVRLQRPRGGGRRSSRRRRPRRPLRRRSRSTRCTSPRARRPCGSATRRSGARACSRCCFGIAVRDHFPEQFLDAHLALFAARHDHGGKLADGTVLRDAVARAGLDPDAVAEESPQQPETLATLGREHTEMRRRLRGVRRADLHRGRRGGVRPVHGARQTSTTSHRALDLLQWSDLNEFKRTRVPR